MRFYYPSFLWALLLAAIPIVIYYVMRFRSLKVAWGATYVLERALTRLRKRLYLKQLILLALRVLVVVALVLAFARPQAVGRSATVSGTGVHRILVVDGSYSMHAGRGDATAWQRAVATMREMVATWGRSERWSLALVTDKVEWVVDDQPIESTEACYEILAELQPREAAAALAPALETILERTGGRRTEIYVMADNQASTWHDVNGVVRPEGPDVRLYWVDTSPETGDNLGVTEVRPSQQRVLPQHPVRVFARVRNFSQVPKEDVDVIFLIDGRHAAKERISLLPGQEAWTYADVVFDEAGSHYVTARLPRDVLETDDAMSAGIQVSPPPAVRVVRDPHRGGKFDSAEGFLELFARVAAGLEDPIEIQPACDSDCSAEDLAEAEVVVVDGGTTLTAELGETLKAYVDRGGCLLLGADDAVRRDAWRHCLGPSGLMPADLGSLQVEPLGGETYRRISRTGFQSPALRAFETDDAGDITATKFYSWFRLENIDEDAEILATFDNGQPFAVISRRDPGTVVLMASGLNCRNNNLIARETGYALVMRLLMTGFAGGIYPRTLKPGSPLRLELDGDQPPTAVQFGFPGEETTPLSVETVGSRQVAVLPQGARRTGLGSVLVLEGDAHRRVWFGIQGERIDSDLTPVSPNIVEELQDRWNLAVATDWEQLSAILADSRHGRPWYTWAIVLVLAAMAGEMAMQRLFV